jgi:hypothetical protein
MTNNGAIFDPVDRSLVVCAKIADVAVFPERDGRITIAISQLDEGIEIVHEDEEALWWPV